MSLNFAGLGLSVMRAKVSLWRWFCLACTCTVLSCAPAPTGSVWKDPRPNENSCQPPCDADEDGIIDTQDNCPDIVNPQQIDTDGDHRGDICDTEPNTPNYRIARSEVTIVPTMSDGSFVLRSQTPFTQHESSDTVFRMRVETRP